MPVRAYLYPFLAMLLWAGNVVVSKLAASSIAPTAITFYRLVLVLLVMMPFIILPLWRNRAAIRRQWWQLALCGVLSFGGLLYLVGRGDVLALLQQGVLLAQTVQRPLFGRYRPAVSGTA